MLFKAAVASLDGCVMGRGGVNLPERAAAAALRSQSSSKSLEGASFSELWKALRPGGSLQQQTAPGAVPMPVSKRF